jgi:hypothetical protein
VPPPTTTQNRCRGENGNSARSEFHMDQIITLLTNLFNLTKVAAVTLPGLLAAGGLALVLWPPAPIDVIPVVVAVTRPAETVPPYNLPNPQSPVVDHSKHPPTASAPTFPSALVAAWMTVPAASGSGVAQRTTDQVVLGTILEGIR